MSMAAAMGFFPKMYPSRAPCSWGCIVLFKQLDDLLVKVLHPWEGDVFPLLHMRIFAAGQRPLCLLGEVGSWELSSCPEWIGLRKLAHRPISL